MSDFGYSFIYVFSEVIDASYKVVLLFLIYRVTMVITKLTKGKK